VNKKTKDGTSVLFPGADISPEAVAFGRAMEKYKREAHRPFPTWLEVLNVAKDLGYRKVALPCLLLLAGLAVASKPRGRPLPFTEDFRSVGGLTDKGWTLRNNSSPGNPIWPTWFLGGQPPAAWFAQPRAGTGFDPPLGYLAANFRVCGGGSNVAGTVSLWAVSPPIRFASKNELSYRVRSAGNAPDVLEVLFAYGETGDPGFTPDGLGDFTHLVDIVEVPTEWTEFNATLLLNPGVGRLALHYYATDSGPAGVNGDYIGISWLAVDTGFYWR
jgi:hypothetical protein